jgi:hypothetical protein
MAAVSILDSLEHLIIVRGAPRVVIEQKAREVLRDFLQFTRSWQYMPAAQNIVATQATYVLLTPGAYAETIAAEWVRVSDPAGSGGDPSTRRMTDWLDRRRPSWRVDSADVFSDFVQETPASITFAAKPLTSIVGGLEYRVSLCPTISATQFDDSTYAEFGEELAAGVRAKLYAMAGEPWHNDKQALAERKEYMAGRGLARITVSKRYGFNDPGQSWVSPYRFA